MRAAQDSNVLVRSAPWAKITGSIALITIVVDRVSKAWIESRLDPGPCIQPDDCIDVIGSLRLHFIENPGMAFSQGESVGPILGVVAIIMSFVLIRIASKAVSPVRHVLIGLILGGAIGNLLDRILRADDGFLSGSVVDFIDLQWFPIWNVADAGITCGVIGLLLLGSRGEPALDSAGPGDAVDLGEEDPDEEERDESDNVDDDASADREHA